MSDETAKHEQTHHDVQGSPTEYSKLWLMWLGVSGMVWSYKINSTIIKAYDNRMTHAMWVLFPKTFWENYKLHFLPIISACRNWRCIRLNSIEKKLSNLISLNTEVVIQFKKCVLNPPKIKGPCDTDCLPKLWCQIMKDKITMLRCS